MSYLEELLPEFRKGAKIRRKDWDKDYDIKLDNESNYIWTNNSQITTIRGRELYANDWELYQEPIDINWDYIIKNKCLCWFWDYNESNKILGFLIKLNENKTLCRFTCQRSSGDTYDYALCRPAHRDEVAFYEEKKDEENFKQL